MSNEKIIGPTRRFATPEEADKLGIATFGTSTTTKEPMNTTNNIDAMVSLFLAWRLPQNFMPDAGISFNPPHNPNLWPTGTNLLTAEQARTMLEYVRGEAGALLSPTDAPASHGCQGGGCLHDSDCAVHNAPALPVGPCDCSAKGVSKETGRPDDFIEAAIQAKGLTAPRVTPADIEANITECVYFSPAELVRPEALRAASPLRLLTFCVLVLRNGFTVTGENACASPENFDAEIGRKIARENAINKVWPLMGYQLKEQLFQMTQPAQSPVEA